MSLSYAKTFSFRSLNGSPAFLCRSLQSDFSRATLNLGVGARFFRGLRASSLLDLRLRRVAIIPSIISRLRTGAVCPFGQRLVLCGVFPSVQKVINENAVGSLLSTEEVPLFRCRHKGVLASQDAFVLSALGVLHQSLTP